MYLYNYTEHMVTHTYTHTRAHHVYMTFWTPSLGALRPVNGNLNSLQR